MRNRVDRFAHGVVDAVRLTRVWFYLALGCLFVTPAIWIIKTFGLNIFSGAATILPLLLALGCFIEACKIFATKQPEPPQAQQQRSMSRSIYIPRQPGRRERRREDRRQ